MKNLTSTNLPELVEEILLGYDNHINPLSDIREKFGVDTHFEYNNGQNEFFLHANSFEQIQKTTGCTENTLFVLLKQEKMQNEDYDETENSVVVFWNGYMCDGSEPKKLPRW